MSTPGSSGASFFAEEIQQLSSADRLAEDLSPDAVGGASTPS
jgi:hypothetical protein